MNQQESII